MRLRILSLGPATLLAFAVSAIANAGSPTSRTLSIQVEESSLLVPTRVSCEWTDEGLEIEGRIEKSRSRYGRILGHAEIELLDEKGRILSRRAGSLQRFSPRRKDPDWASFRVLIETIPANAVAIRVRPTTGIWP
jgi:hypothetical protein